MPVLPNRATGGSVYTGVPTPTRQEHQAMHSLDRLPPLKNERDAALESYVQRAGEITVAIGDSTSIDDEARGWQDFANCLGVDPELFFPERGESTREAKEVCKGCSVREDCLEYALSNGEKFGIWGGLSERERRRIRRQRAIARRAALELDQSPELTF